MADFDFGEDDELQKYLKRMDVSRANQESQAGMASISGAPPPNPYKEEEKQSGWQKIVSPIMKIGGMAADLLGFPEVGVPLSIAGGAVGGSSNGGGISGALKGGVMSGIGEAASAGMGSAFDFMKSPIDDPISTGGLTIPGRRENAIDLTSQGLTVPASPTAFGGGS